MPAAWPPAVSPATTALPDPSPADGQLRTEFVGTPGPLFRLSLWTGFLTVLTLGLYRFWMKSRLRRWYWSSVRPGGIPLEYTGLPSEKLLGFLIAVVILAFYIGVVNLILMFLSLSLLAENLAAYLVSFLGVIPLWFFARYRMRRYILARTRWRGIRFGLLPGAWGYAVRAMGHWILTILSLGILWPRMTFGLEKYRTDRTFFGSTRLTQGGEWGMLMPHYVHALAGGILSGGFALVSLGDHPNFGWLLLVTVPWLFYGICHYQAGATRELAATKSAAGIGLDARPRPQRVTRIYLFGTLGAVLILLVPFLAISVAILAMQGNDALFAALPPAVWAALGALLYFVVFLLWSTLRHVYILMPLWRHYAETLTVTGAESILPVEQRGRDGSREAGGFAEALDVGAAI